MSKAGVLAKELLEKDNDIIDLDDVEVKLGYLLIFHVMLLIFSPLYFFFSGLLGQAWRTRS